MASSFSFGLGKFGPSSRPFCPEHHKVRNVRGLCCCAAAGPNSTTAGYTAKVVVEIAWQVVTVASAIGTVAAVSGPLVGAFYKLDAMEKQGEIMMRISRSGSTAWRLLCSSDSN
ncbi:hypothetical protein Vretifemale_17987 [Volvox reticuliferus]|uniref:Uncharacterized protein n=1 Tax=Volvox reticuliferus TaxID=1737510 RepID=A0A8J4FX71_9CHLO|nr:hypothetical protein Vretifemale_17987 [Volvox reticuliferus]